MLRAYLAQRDQDFELLVADDGSTEETRLVVDRFRAAAMFAVEHVWHADTGFRLAAIRNRALAMASGEYVVFTDGDCVPGRGFTANLKSLARPDWFVAGSRILMSESATRDLLDPESDVPPLDTWSSSRWLKARLRGDLNRLMPLVRLPSLGPTRSEGWKACRGFCIAGWRRDFVGVNGFDESYEGWGLEDSDLAIRMLQRGVKLRKVRNGIGLVHLWHPENPRDNLEQNQKLLDELQASGRTRALRGLSEASGRGRRTA